MPSSSKYRNVFGGLDNAARQAEQKGLQDLFIVDTDCHIDEPFTWFPRYMSDEWGKKYRNVQLSPELEEVAAQVQQEVTAAIEAEERELELMRMEGEQEEMAAE